VPSNPPSAAERVLFALSVAAVVCLVAYVMIGRLWLW
jgi:hypothetical protein